VTGGGNSVNNSGDNWGGNCGEVLFPCYSRDVHQLPAALFTLAASVSSVASTSVSSVSSVASTSVSSVSSVASTSVSSVSSVASTSVSSVSSVASTFVQPSRVASSFNRLDPFNRSVRSTARPPRACSPSRFAHQSARRGCSPSRLGFRPPAARARSSTTTTSLHAGTIRARLAHQPPPPGRIGRRVRRSGGSSRRGDRRNGAPG